MYFNAAGEYGGNPAIRSGTTNAFSLFYQDGLGASFNPATAQVTTNNAANLGPFDLENIGTSEYLAVVMTESIAHDTSGDLYTVIQYRTPVGSSTPVLASVTCLLTDQPLISGLVAVPPSGTLGDGTGVTVEFEAISTLGDPTSVHWDFGDGDVDDTGTLTPSHEFLTAGMWPVTVTATNDMGSSDARAYIPIAPYDAPTVHAGRQIKTADYIFVLDNTTTPNDLYIYAIADASSIRGPISLATGLVGLCMAYNETSHKLYITDTANKNIAEYTIIPASITTDDPLLTNTIGAGKFEGSLL
jgi:hypothetical protein